MKWLKRLAVWAGQKLLGLGGEVQVTRTTTSAILIFDPVDGLSLVLPDPAQFEDADIPRQLAMMAAAAMVAVRDHAVNLTFYEAVCRAGIELGLSDDFTRKFAGDMVNTFEVDDRVPAMIEGAAP